MLLKLAALGALGYAGYRYYQNNMSTGSDTGETTPNVSDPNVALAGGPLSEQAQVIEAGQPLPAG